MELVKVEMIQVKMKQDQIKGTVIGVDRSSGGTAEDFVDSGTVEDIDRTIGVKEVSCWKLTVLVDAKKLKQDL